MGGRQKLEGTLLVRRQKCPHPVFPIPKMMPKFQLNFPKNVQYQSGNMDKSSPSRTVIQLKVMTVRHEIDYTERFIVEVLRFPRNNQWVTDHFSYQTRPLSNLSDHNTNLTDLQRKAFRSALWSTQEPELDWKVIHFIFLDKDLGSFIFFRRIGSNHIQQIKDQLVRASNPETLMSS